MLAEHPVRHNSPFAALPVQPCADELVRTHNRLVQRLARETFMRVSSATPIEDLVQIGQIALIEASRVFIDRGEATFSTYATFRVRGAMIDALRKSATITRSSMQKRRQFEHAHQSLHGALGRKPTDHEMAQHVDMAVDSYRAACRATIGVHTTSLDESYSDHNDWFVDDTPDAFVVLDKARERDSVAAAMRELPEREQVILQLFYVDECTLEDIGNIFGIHAARVCQIKKCALGKMRALLNGRVERNN